MGLVNNDTRAVKIDLGGKMAAAVLAGEETHILNAIRERCVREANDSSQMWDSRCQGRISELAQDSDSEPGRTGKRDVSGRRAVARARGTTRERHRPQGRDRKRRGNDHPDRTEHVSFRAGLATILGTMSQDRIQRKTHSTDEWPVLLDRDEQPRQTHSSGGGRERLNRWRTRITIWHLSPTARPTSSSEADQKRKDAARSLADYGARVEHDDSGKIVKIVLGDEVVWSPERVRRRNDGPRRHPAEYQSAVTGWHVPEEGQLKPNRLRIALDSYLMTTVEATLSGNGIDGDAELVSARKPSFRAEICANSWHPGRDFGTNSGDGGA